VPENTVAPNDDGTYLELDSDGTPLGKWDWDDDSGRWVYEPIPQGGIKVNPKTGERNALADVLMLAALLTAFAETLAIFKRGARGRK
jgi:hypothetical protein